MKTPLERKFLRCGRAGAAMFLNEEFALVPYSYSKDVACIQHAKSLIFKIIHRTTRREAGELALRIGESPCMFYLGHIGYHIDPPYRGHAGAYQACSMCVPLLRDLGLRTLVITTDDDNYPSIRTCEKLGCRLECTVDVPLSIQKNLRSVPENVDISGFYRMFSKRHKEKKGKEKRKMLLGSVFGFSFCIE